MKKKKIILELNYKELDALTELVYLGHEVMNGQRKNRKKRSDDMYEKIVAEYKERTLERHPEQAKDMENMQDYFFYCCLDYLVEYENERFPELLAWKLSNVKGDIPKIRDFIKKSKIFNN